MKTNLFLLTMLAGTLPLASCDKKTLRMNFRDPSRLR